MNPLWINGLAWKEAFPFPSSVSSRIGISRLLFSLVMSSVILGILDSSLQNGKMSSRRCLRIAGLMGMGTPSRAITAYVNAREK